MRAALLALLGLVACASPSPDGRVPLDQRHPLAEEYYLMGVLADGTVDPAWGTGPDAALPDTLGWPRLDLVAWLAALQAAPADTLRANVAVEVAGFQLCPPCPPRGQCQPCPPLAVVGRQRTVGGDVLGWFEVPPGRGLGGLYVGQRVVVSAEAVPNRGLMPAGLAGLTAAGLPGTP